MRCRKRSDMLEAVGNRSLVVESHSCREPIPADQKEIVLECKLAHEHAQ
jgi:hypothetical protein